MTSLGNCPACGARAGGGYQAVAPGRVKCSACGAQLVHRLSLMPLVLLACVVGVVTGLATSVLLDVVLKLPVSGQARTLVVGVATGVAVPFLARRFRRLHVA